MKRLCLIGLSLLLTGSVFSQIRINELCAANGDVIHDPLFYNFPSWIELHNTGNADVDLSGYYISDKSLLPTKWQIPTSLIIPAGGYVIIWCDDEATGSHTNFSLDSDGEEVVLSAPDGTLVDKILFPRQYLNVTYGRSGNSGDWNYLLTPTPGAANGTETGTRALEKVGITPSAGRYSSSQAVTLTHPDPAAEIRYTLDGSEPTVQSEKYLQPITIGSTATVKAKAFKAGVIPGNTEVSTFLIGERVSSLPVISLSTDPRYLSDNTIGIYVQGTNGVPGRGVSYAANWNQNWWRHFDMEYFDQAGARKFDESVDLRIHGGHSRRRPQKSFSIKARDKYGKKTISYNPFPNKTIESFGGLLLRNSGNDWDLTLFRDALMHNILAGEMDVDYQDYQPSSVFLNGQYWGILNVRERIDGDYIESNYGYTDIDLLEGGGDAQEGTNQVYAMYMDSLRRIEIGNPKMFSFIDRYIDVQEYINYQIANIYYGNVDWPGNNVTFWRPRQPGGKFRWILWDMDYGFQLSDEHTPATFPALEWATDPDNVDGLNKEWSTRHFRTVLRNPVFRNRFIQTLTTAIQTTFHPDRVIAKIDEFENRIKDEMPYHQDRWGNPVNWAQHVQKLRDFASARNTFMLQHTAEFFGLGQVVHLNVRIQGAEGGGFRLNGVRHDENKENVVYFRNTPFEASPAVLPGYQFKNWTITARSYEPLKLIDKEAVWKYHDVGGNPGALWRAVNFDDASWKSGQAQLGYGENDEKTVVSYGPDRANKHITTYFRKQFSVSSLDQLEDITGHVVFDDGVAVYVNGVEVYRNNLPGGELAFNTLALRSYSPENHFHYFVIDKELLQEGVNVVAVEVHQNEPASSDLSFDLHLDAHLVGEEKTQVVTDPIVKGYAYGDVSLTIAYEPAASKVGVVINEFCATDSNVKDDRGEPTDWIELHNTTSHPIDIGGIYITDNLSNKKKHRIPVGSPLTIIQPGGYLVLFADEEPQQGPLHVNLKLSSNGESIGIYDERGSELIKLDEVTYGPVNDFESQSRIPNATGPFVATSTMSPGEENAVISSVDPERLRFSVYPNPTNGILYIGSDRAGLRFQIADVLGRTLMEVKPSDDASVDVSHLPNGIYLLKGLSSNRAMTVRFVKE